jgi:arylsulfatase A-like enzyme
MIRDERWKLVTYHGHDQGELFDLERDPWEHENLWDDGEYSDVRFRLLKASFDQTARAVDLGPVQTTYY